MKTRLTSNLLFGLATSQYLNAQRFAQEAVREDIILK